MCGIFGYFDRSGETAPYSLLERMGASIKHRGPDDRGIFASEGVALGNQRLSIIDLAEGHQPFVSDDGKIVVVQNGEIFNHIELAEELKASGHPCRTHSDTEVILRLYEREGIDFVSRLNGMFAISIYDGREKVLYLVRDRIGEKPFYYHDNRSRVVFGSEIKALFPLLGQVPEVNEEAIHHYLSFNYIPSPLTLFEGVWHVKPGHLLKITKDGKEETRWWNLASICPEHGRSEEAWIEEFHDILDDAVRIRMRSDVPFGAFLSGGVDSSTIVGLMSRHSSSPIKTFCIGFDDPRFDESPFASLAARRFGADHIMQKVDPNMVDIWPMALYHCDQPHGDISFLPTYRVSKLASDYVKVVLTGDGGDELFAGYDKYLNFFASQARNGAKRSATTFHRDYFESISLFTPDAKEKLYRFGFKAKMKGVDSFAIADRHFTEISHQDEINQALYVDMQLLLSGNNLVKPDRMGMAVSIEARAPFLDYRMMEFAFRMPGSLKLHAGETKYLYKKAVESLIGNDLTYRKKQMFTVPVGEWFKTHLSDYCRSHLDKLIEVSDTFDPGFIHTLHDDHASGRANNTRELRALIALNLSLQNVAGQRQSFVHAGGR